MRSYRTVTVKQKELDGVVCNACGEKINRIASGLWEDHLSIEKLWGYSSPYDGESHRFEICAECYKKWVESFALPPERNEHCIGDL